MTKGDLNATAADLRLDMQRVKNELLKFSFAAMAAQTALIVALLELLKKSPSEPHGRGRGDGNGVPASSPATQYASN